MNNSAHAIATHPDLPTIGSLVFWASIRFLVLGYHGQDILLAYVDADPAHRWEAGTEGRLELAEFFGHYRAECANCDRPAELDRGRCEACEWIAYQERKAVAP